MNFLLKLVIAGGIVCPLAAAPIDSMVNVSGGTDSLLVNDVDENEGKGGSATLLDLNNSYTIANPYVNPDDAPFTISTKRTAEAAAPLAARVSCGGRIWTDGEYLGRTQDDRPVYTRITENRIYLNWAGEVSGNIFILFHLKEGTFPATSQNDVLINACVNPVDPSTARVNLLGRRGDVITCNNIDMVNGDRLGVFVDNGAQTFQYIKYVDGLLRVMIKQGINDTRNDNYTMSLMPETIQEAHGSTMDAKYKGKFTLDMLNGCFWPVAPKPATPLADSNCPSGPVLSGSPGNISQTGLRFNYTGSGISTIKWRIKSNGTEVRSGTTIDLGGSTSVTIGYLSLSPGTYILEIEGGNCSSTISSTAFTIEQPGIPNCQNGPAINGISNITPASATIAYGGSNLHIFSWRILQNSYAVASGQTDYISNNSAALVFNYLNNGNYTLEVTPVDCKAAPVTQAFSVSATDTRPTCQRGPNLVSVLSSNNNAVEFLFDGENIFAIDWKIMDGTTPVRQNRVAPQSNHPTAQFATLPNGVYTLQITGGNCKSTASATRFGINLPLPITIANFEGKVAEKGVELSWEVVAEQDGKEFEILRYDEQLKNGRTIGKVALLDQRTGWYHFTDENPLMGINYYQLKQIDADGTFTKSKIISVNPMLLTQTIVAPNPAQEYVDVQFSSRTSGLSEVHIYNNAGVAVGASQIRITEGKNSHRINVKRFPAGNYFLKISHEGEENKLRFTKVN
ncbi:T9SS type A sorting domain-containing protein [Dyadobacter sandarakinus]|uniref:T9SS type A sorting domain-containing protein n=1 Tax=Dyadobacter sandarakinus TaxID=2747268 RepID=A0ABX7ID14_9BACT|nr:T9SS type A sorting domain-containing protein [Dyadobacter sandarakinus]QRR03700.1 T9SS type A sorting domain-containing protein [Dyadobacter sandarakinus]